VPRAAIDGRLPSSATDRAFARSAAASLWFKGVLPLLGGLVLLGAFVLSVRSYLPAASSASSLFGMGGIFVIGAGSLLLGVVVMLITRWRSPEFFRSGPVSAGAPSAPTMQRPLVAADRSSS